MDYYCTAFMRSSTKKTFLKHANIFNKPTIKNSLSFVLLMKYFILIFLLAVTIHASAQKTIRGIVKDAHSEEPVPFASIQFKGTNIGVVSDTAGRFSFSLPQYPSDTLLFTCVGFQPYQLFIKKDTLDMTVTIPMERGGFNETVIIKSPKIDRGLWLWKKIVQHKPENNRYKYDNFSYELYNKLQLDLKNFNSLKRISNIKPLKPINELIRKNTDTVQGKEVLPTYLTESLSDYYYQKKPLKRREEIKAVNTNGVKNESMIKFLGGMDQVFNVYQNYLNVFDKEFISPLSDNGDFYYKYFVTDTQQIGSNRYFRLVFTPRRVGMNTFTGDCWVHAGTFGIYKINLSLDKSTDINFMDKFSFVQEFKQLSEDNWFVSREKMVVDISPAGNKLMGVVGHKTSTYQNIIVNDSSVTKKLQENKEQEEVHILPQAAKKEKTFWNGARPEELSRSEQGIIKMIDTLLNTPSYQRITKKVVFLTTGYVDVGNVQLGSAYNWFSGNSWEGFRMRFDAASNQHFNKKLRWHTYLAYGFNDQKFKGLASLFYLPKRDPRKYWYVGYKNDLDFGQNYYGEISQDNIFSFAIRKPNIPSKFINLEQFRFEFFNELRSGFSTRASITNNSYTPLKNLIPVKNFETDSKKFTATELALTLRFAFQEKFIESQFFRTSLGSPYPIVEATVTQGINGILNGNYHYTKVLASVSDYVPTPPLGAISYQAYAGRTFGTLPYTFLDIAAGNEMYYYNKYAFNLMNRYEFIHDKFAGINYEHNIGPGIFRFVPKLKFRQFYTVKALWGNLSNANRSLNFVNGNTFQTLNDKVYLEVGTGVDNIFRFLRIDFIWRLLPQSAATTAVEKFGIFGSVRFNF
jgi:hypothetical protein